MEQRPSSKRNSYSARQEIPRILRNHRFRSQINPVHAPQRNSQRFILVLFSHLRLGLPSVSFPQVSPPKPCVHLSSPPYGRDSSVSIAIRYGLKGLGIESRWRARFSAPVQTGPWAHPASFIMGTGSVPGGKTAGAWR